MTLFEIDKDAPFYIAGHRGMVGSAMWRLLESKGHTNLIGKTRQELDLTDRKAVFDFFEQYKPRYVVLAAAKVGGILANDTYPVQFLSENLQIQTNVMDAALEHDVERLVFLGSSCAYPKDAPQPIKEEYLLTGPLEPTNEAYAIAKIAGIKQVQAVRKQYGKSWISVMPTNLYGPGDSYDPEKSHVIPGVVMKLLEAKAAAQSKVFFWGSGRPQREFLHVDDLASAIELLMANYNGNEAINIGSGQELSVRDLVELGKKLSGFGGNLIFDKTRPDGVLRKRLDISNLTDLGWESQLGLEKGLAEVIRERSNQI